MAHRVEPKRNNYYPNVIVIVILLVPVVVAWRGVFTASAFVGPPLSARCGRGFYADGGALPSPTPSSSSSSPPPSGSTTKTVVVAVAALTERQLQFWEDVDDGLDDIANFWDMQRGQKLDRIRQFAKSARGESAPPVGSTPQHEPSEEHVHGLTAQPFWDVNSRPDLFPWAAGLEANAGIIQREFQEKLLQSDKFASDSVWQNQVMGEGWSAIRLQRLGVWNTDNCRAFPQSYELLRSLAIPLAVRGVCFARQAPNSGVQPHSDGRNFILTSHLGLKIPDGCWIQVGDERRGWEEGKLTTIDTSFVHSTGNPSAQADRHVLIIDYWHPELSQAERAALEFVYDLRNKFETGDVPSRRPRSLQGEEEGGLAAWFGKLTGGG